jgi:serine/threonine-protein kinase
MTDEELPLAKGTLVGAYEIERLIGCGGMSKVYLARQLSLDRMVALKVIEGVVDNEETLAIFKAEIKTTAQINHRNVVSVMEGGVSDGKCFFSMNFIDGSNIDELVERHKFIAEPRAIRIILDVAEALRHLHDRLQISHKDIKPGNIMIDQADEVFLLDFGIAKYVGDKSGGTVMGSPYYMSPEQIQGKALDWRTDLYSLGATFYFMVFGTPPYDGDEPNEILQMHLKGDFPIPEKWQVRSRVGDTCLKLIAKMMARQRSARHESWDAFIAELKRVQTPAQEPQPKAPMTRRAHPPKPKMAARKPMVLSLPPPAPAPHIPVMKKAPPKRPMPLPPPAAPAPIPVVKKEIPKRRMEILAPEKKPLVVIPVKKKKWTLLDEP